MFYKIKKRFPICIQHDVMDCGVACVKMLTDYHGQSFALDELKSICNPTREGVSLSNVAKTLDSVATPLLEDDCLLNVWWIRHRCHAFCIGIRNILSYCIK